MKSVDEYKDINSVMRNKAIKLRCISEMIVGAINRLQDARQIYFFFNTSQNYKTKQIKQISVDRLISFYENTSKN